MWREVVPNNETVFTSRRKKGKYNGVPEGGNLTQEKKSA